MLRRLSRLFFLTGDRFLYLVESCVRALGNFAFPRTTQATDGYALQ